MKKKKVEREEVKINTEEFGDFTGHGPWEINGETYTYVDDIPSVGKSDGEDHTIIVERKSDGKFFSFFWWYSHSSGNYYFEDACLEEVFKTTKITYE